MKKIIFYYEFVIFIILNSINFFQQMYPDKLKFNKYNQECIFVLLFYHKYRTEGMRLANILQIIAL